MELDKPITLALNPDKDDRIVPKQAKDPDPNEMADDLSLQLQTEADTDHDSQLIEQGDISTKIREIPVGKRVHLESMWDDNSSPPDDPPDSIDETLPGQVDDSIPPS